MDNVCEQCNNRFKCLTGNRAGNCIVMIEAKRWFERTNGNTYHSVNVYVNNELIGRVPFTYGYGEQYIETAFDILAEWGMFPYEKTDELITVNAGQPNEYQTTLESRNRWDARGKFRHDQMENRQKYLVRCFDVKRKKDL